MLTVVKNHLLTRKHLLNVCLPELQEAHTPAAKHIFKSELSSMHKIPIRRCQKSPNKVMLETINPNEEKNASEATIS